MINNMMSYVMVIWLPVGIFILFNIETVESRFMTYAREATSSQPAYFSLFGKTYKRESPKWWNKMVLIMIGIVCILIGLLSLINITMTLLNNVL